MDSGLIQILVIAFFIIISVMDGAARKKRREAQRQEAQRRGEVEPGEGEGVADAGERRSLKTDWASRGRMSEGMVPDELWEEIAALGRGGPPSGTSRAPYEADRSPSGFEPTMPAPVPEPEETMLRPEHQHVEMHDHVEWEWKPELEAEAYRLAPAPDEDPAYPVAPAPDEDRPARTEERAVTPSAPHPDEQPGHAPRTLGKGQSVRRTLKHGGSASIRKAVILAEILGPPAALRDFGHEPPG